jgi:hypothetical protein
MAALTGLFPGIVFRNRAGFLNRSRKVEDMQRAGVSRRSLRRGRAYRACAGLRAPARAGGRGD